MILQPSFSLLAAQSGGVFSTGELGLFIVVAVGMLALAAWLLSVPLTSRRRSARDARAIIAALEDLRAGRAKSRPEIETGSPAALIFDAIERLGRDLGTRTKSSEETDRRLRTMLGALSESAVVTADADGDIRSFSEGSRVLFGWEEHEVVSRPIAMLFEEESFRDFLPKLARRSLRERGIQARTRLLRRDGTSFSADIAVRSLQLPAGDASGFLLVARDVTEQSELERRLRESEQRYRGLIEGLAEAVLIVRGGRVVYANPAFARLCDLSPTQLVGARLRDRIATRDVLLVEDRLAWLEGRAGATERLRSRLIASDDGAMVDVCIDATAIDFADNPAVLLVIRDETAQSRVEAELRRNESQLDAVLEATEEGILVLVEGGHGARVQMTNRAFLQRFGLRQDEILGMTEERLRRRFERAGGDAEAVAHVLQATAADNARQTARNADLEVTVASLVDRTGRALGRVVACRDLSDQRESERKLQLHAEQLQLSKVMLQQANRKLDGVNQDLQARTQQLDTLNRELRKLDEMKSNLLGNVSHELQTPLVSIRGYTEMILKGRLGSINEDQNRGLTLCLKNIDRLISMIDNLLVFSRSEPDLGALKLERFALHALIDEVIALLQDKLRDRELTVHKEIAGGDLPIHADRDKTQQVFINLLSNAIKFNKEGGSITITAKPGSPGFAAVVMEDTGVGIPPAEQERIFDRDYQVKRDGMESPQGSGIGLAIVRDILRSHGCLISVESEEGKGARFRFTLPMGAEQDEATHRAPSSSPPVVEAPPEPEVTPRTETAPAATDAAEPAGDDAEPASRPRFRIIRRGGS
jgi:PAS domain S-box-containing protein